MFVNIPGYEGLYQIDWELNQVKSLRKPFWKESILKNGCTNNHLAVVLYNKDGVAKSFGLHNIVMLIKEGPCPDGMEVCHNDGNSLNNFPENLRYDTHRSNSLDSVKHGTNHFTTNNPMTGHFGKRHHLSKGVLQFSLDGNFIQKWDSTMDVQRGLNYSNSLISNCCRGGVNSAYGFIWKYSHTDIGKRLAKVV